MADMEVNIKAHRLADTWHTEIVPLPMILEQSENSDIQTMSATYFYFIFMASQMSKYFMIVQYKMIIF